ncbi:MAG: 1,2-phenylacetyl-CoA epoxidase subunit PaaA [Armatimonadota bacterium]|nr:1,2-phenylacetyl-CoA epoxidase subunit PaaA [Armatimonadota bacterium]MDR7422589.1 1,2-phenylacetyl-CoA epoxidase subunit PaaA [Armatimonadota bacterium]MDR7453590.1 1,2-phenylacetyl-CoA epoxidase subunit PaaA [Armatimonadota bacterium]MDR7456930.1 1,2-phenylacetyl-CoA epoxidase subunit PaaA [Armatimonadota bacterium]MDR7496662.1 1,2-phenylacetyl-CoA epoxidase subunit PaaA [Armatimonadota bacterium]
MTVPPEAADEPEQLGAFEARLAAGDRVEAGEWMPARYRAECLRLIQMHANSELMGALPEREWIPRAPTLARKMALVAKVQDEIGHAQLLYRVAEDLGKPRTQMIEELIAGASKFHNVFHYPAETWADVAIIQVFVDGAAMQTQGSLRSCSYAPYARVLKRICYEEDFHIRLGLDSFRALAEGTPRQRAMLQDALDRWWQPIMHFFGPRDQVSPHLETMMRWRIKVKTNDELRQQFLRQFVPVIQEYGLRVPDPDLRWDETAGQYRYAEPDWEEFRRVIRGEGPRTKARLELRQRYHAQHRWVREAVARWALAA